MRQTPPTTLCLDWHEGDGALPVASHPLWPHLQYVLMPLRGGWRVMLGSQLMPLPADSVQAAAWMAAHDALGDVIEAAQGRMIHKNAELDQQRACELLSEMTGACGRNMEVAKGTG